MVDGMVERLFHFESTNHRHDSVRMKTANFFEPFSTPTPPIISKPRPHTLVDMAFPRPDPETTARFNDILFSSDHVLIKGLIETVSVALLTRSSSTTRPTPRPPTSVSCSPTSARTTSSPPSSSGSSNRTSSASVVASTASPPAQDYNPRIQPCIWFSTIYSHYVQLYLSDYIKTALEPVFTQLITPHAKRLSISNILSVSHDSTDACEYEQFLSLMVDVISTFNATLVKNVHLLPDEFAFFIQSIGAILKAHRGCKRDLLTPVFRDLFYNQTILPIFSHPQDFFPAYTNTVYLQNKYILDFFRETILKLHSYDCQPQDNYLFAILPSIDSDPTNDILEFLLAPERAQPEHAPPDPVEPPLDELLNSVRENILSIIDYLPRRICDVILEVTGVQHFVLDDHSLLRSLHEALDLYNEQYNTSMNALVPLYKEKQAELASLLREYHTLAKTLVDLQEENVRLQTALDECGKRPGSQLERYQPAPFEAWIPGMSHPQPVERQDSNSDEKLRHGFLSVPSVSRAVQNGQTRTGKTNEAWCSTCGFSTLVRRHIEETLLCHNVTHKTTVSRKR